MNLYAGPEGLSDQKGGRRPSLGGTKTYILHNPDSLLCLPYELILLLFHLCPCLLAHHLIIRVHASGASHLPLGLGCVKTQPRILDSTPRFRRKHQICVQRSAPTGQEPLLNLHILR